MRVFEAICSCATHQPRAADYSVGSIVACPLCGQLWAVRTRASNTRVSGGGLAGHALIGGTRRSPDIHVWERVGGNVALQTAKAAARADAEAQYEADHAELVRRIEAGQMPQGSTVRVLRAHKTSEGMRGVMPMFIVWAVILVMLTGWAALLGAWAGLAIIGSIWTIGCIGKQCETSMQKSRLLKSVR